MVQRASTLSSFVVGLAAAALAACGPDGHAPELQPVTDQVVAVNQELVLVLSAADDDGDELSYSFESEVPGIYGRAQVSRLPVGAGEFRWTPDAADIGIWFFDFTVSDGSHTDTVTARIEVRAAIGDNSAPRFLHPQGMGTTLDLAARQCIELDIEVVDSDSAEVDIAVERPGLEGGTLEQTSGLTAVYSWCPTPAQIAADDRYTITLSADDRDNPKTVLPFLLVLRKPLKPDCPGEPPIIAHSPADEDTIAGLTIPAEISDDQGLKRAPLLYWSLTRPSSPPDLSKMNQVQMLLVDGDMQDGLWAADVPNPTVGTTAGSMRELYYIIVASDDDDRDGDCDHLSQGPGEGVYQMTVTNPGGPGGAGLCEPCTADVQCGSGDGDLCVLVGSRADSYCLQACDGAGDCPAGYECSAQPVESVEGQSGRQCVPESASCTMVSTCDDDAHENDDSRDEAQQRPVLEEGVGEFVSCPADTGFGDDEDWFELFLSGDNTTTVTLVGGDQSDLDLELYDAAGERLARSVTFSSTEEVTACLPGGFYYVRVLAFGARENPYLLELSKSPMSCDLAACVDDGNENDDGRFSARETVLPHLAVEQQICTGDDDWYRVELENSDLLIVDLEFAQEAAGQDLDIHLYDDMGVDLTPCSPQNVSSCQLDNGQSGTSNEHFEYSAPASGCSPCVRHVVVRGFDGSENQYDILIDVQ